MTGSAVPRRMLGRELKVLRERSQMSATVACRAIEISPQTLWRIESGQPGPKLKELYVHVLCQMYGATQDITTALVALVAEAKRPSWWHQFKDVVPEYAELFMGFEEAAERVTSFRQDIVPDLLRTAEYHRAIVLAEFPGRPSCGVDRMIDVLRRRQAELRAGASRCDFRALVCEATLRNQVGGPGVMPNQLHHLVRVSELPGVSIRIVPQRVGGHPGLITGPFDMLEFPVHPVSQVIESPVVHVPGYRAAHYHHHENDITRYRAAIAEIQCVALDKAASRSLLLDIARDYPG